MLDVSAIILSGGKNTRMNCYDKSLLKFGEETFIEKIIKEVNHFNQIIISTNDPKPNIYADVEYVKDIHPGQGPLSGIHAGLTRSKFNRSLVLAIDMPFLKRDLLEYLAGIAPDYDVVVPRMSDFYQPLCAIYSKACLPFIESNIINNIRKTTSFYKDVKVKYVDAEELRLFGDFEWMFNNINTPKDYDDYCRINDIGDK